MKTCVLKVQIRKNLGGKPNKKLILVSIKYICFINQAVVFLLETSRGVFQNKLWTFEHLSEEVKLFLRLKRGKFENQSFFNFS